MGCNCKNADRIQKLIPNANDKIHTKQGIQKILWRVFDTLKRIILKIGVLMIVLILLPIIFIVISFTLFYRDKATIPVPKKIVQKLINEDKQNHI